MHEKESDQFVDDLLDASLKQFRGDEPRPGLEGRILAGARARQAAAQRRTFWTWAWALGGLSAVVAGVVLIVNPSRRPAARVPSAPTVLRAGTSRPEAPKVAAEVLPQVTARESVRASVRPSATQPSYSQQFPTPAPLTNQEKLLLAFVEAIPESPLPAETAEQGTQEIQIPPLAIAAIEIKPLPDPINGQEK